MNDWEVEAGGVYRTAGENEGKVDQEREPGNTQTTAGVWARWTGVALVPQARVKVRALGFC